MKLNHNVFLYFAVNIINVYFKKLGDKNCGKSILTIDLSCVKNHTLTSEFVYPEVKNDSKFNKSYL